jgi:glycine/D-amino acid oxidase-like deaminating enzyme
MARRKHVIVIGAGIIGASIAWHLAAAGARVTILDAGEAGGVATPNSFAWINASWGNPEPYFRLRIRAMAEWRRLAAELPDIPLAWSGGLLWDLPAAELEGYAREHGAWGYGIRRVDRSEALRVEPGLAEPPDFALHVAEEGAVEPAVAARLLIEDCARHSGRFMPRTIVSALNGSPGRISSVITSSGRLDADDIVVAAGADTPRLAASVGVSVPLTAPPGLIVHSHPHPRLLNGLVMSPRLHMRQTSGWRIIASADFSGGDPGPDPAAAARQLFSETRAMLKDAERLALDFHTIGYRPMPADGFPHTGSRQRRERALRRGHSLRRHAGAGGGPLRGRRNSPGSPGPASSPLYGGETFIDHDGHGLGSARQTYGALRDRHAGPR